MPSRDNDHLCPPAVLPRGARQERRAADRCSRVVGQAQQCRFAGDRQSKDEPVRWRRQRRPTGD
eukprot:5387471-Alexandrium_andersonii.AAC.1